MCAAAAGLDIAVAAIAADPVPLCETGYAALKRMIAALSGLDEHGARDRGGRLERPRRKRPASALRRRR